MQKELHDIRFIRLPEVLSVIPVSRSTFYAGMKSGRFPQSVKLGRITAWKCAEIRALIENPEQSVASNIKGGNV